VIKSFSCGKAMETIIGNVWSISANSLYLSAFLLAFVLYMLQSCKSHGAILSKIFASLKILDVSAGRNLVLVRRKREQGVRRKSVGSSTFPQIVDIALPQLKLLITPRTCQGNARWTTNGK
jgi:hypothetical protein